MTRLFTWAACVAAACLLASCAYVPRAVEGLPTGAPFLSLPLGVFLDEREVAAQAVTACMDEGCPHQIAVGLFTARGEAAATLAGVLANPERLATALRRADAADTDKRRTLIRTRVSVSALAEAGATGFLIALGRGDDTRKSAYGIALGKRQGETLRVLIVIGRSADSVRAIARDTAAATFR